MTIVRDPWPGWANIAVAEARRREFRGKRRKHPRGYPFGDELMREWAIRPIQLAHEAALRDGEKRKHRNIVRRTLAAWRSLAKQ